MNEIQTFSMNKVTQIIMEWGQQKWVKTDWFKHRADNRRKQ